jgi:hypothetical protein
MATEGKSTFPMLPMKHWWTIRERFKQSIPGTVTANYLATVLDMQVNSARANILPFLVSFGIIDESGSTLDRAKRWRDDVEYPSVCEEIVADVYPQELRDAVPNPDKDRQSAERWFANHTGAGQTAVGRMISTYSVLMSGDPDKAEAPKQNKAKSSATKKVAKKKVTTTTSRVDQKPDHKRKIPQEPDISINLQIHISSDATPDQIDQIFSSMAKHIYQKN